MAVIRSAPVFHGILDRYPHQFFNAADAVQFASAMAYRCSDRPALPCTQIRTNSVVASASGAVRHGVVA